MRKGTTLRIFRIFILKRLYLWNHSSYELQTWHEYSYIILLHSLQIASPAHIRCGRGERAARQSRSKIAVLCLIAFWWLTARDRKLAVASNVGSVK